MKSLKLLALPLLAATLMGTGCDTMHTSSSKQGDGDRTAGRVQDDNNITSKVHTALKSEPNYKFDDVTVSTYRGIVQLSGWAGSDDQKETAGRLVRNIPGVTDVINNITVKEIDDAKIKQTSQVNQSSGQK